MADEQFFLSREVLYIKSWETPTTKHAEEAEIKVSESRIKQLQLVCWKS
jgi:hypothetical protein